MLFRSRIRLAGQGGIGAGGAKGDFELIVKMIPHKTFECKGNDLYTGISIDLYTAVLGGKVKLDTLKGAINLNIPKCSQNGKTMRLQKMGMPVYGKTDEFGDLYVTLHVKLPENLNEKEMKFFKELQAMRN